MRLPFDPVRRRVSHTGLCREVKLNHIDTSISLVTSGRVFEAHETDPVDRAANEDPGPGSWTRTDCTVRPDDVVQALSDPDSNPSDHDASAKACA